MESLSNKPMAIQASGLTFFEDEPMRLILICGEGTGKITPPFSLVRIAKEISDGFPLSSVTGSPKTWMSPGRA
jgi:hypothetical protein